MWTSKKTTRHAPSLHFPSRRSLRIRRKRARPIRHRRCAGFHRSNLHGRPGDLCLALLESDQPREIRWPGARRLPQDGKCRGGKSLHPDFRDPARGRHAVDQLAAARLAKSRAGSDGVEHDAQRSARRRDGGPHDNNRRKNHRTFGRVVRERGANPPRPCAGAATSCHRAMRRPRAGQQNSGRRGGDLRAERV